MKFILYTRKSTEQEERQTLSIEAQLRELREIAAKEQLEIVASLCEARTAREPGRTAFAEMLEMIERGKADGILSWHPDRLARNSVDGGRIIYLLDTGKLKALRFPTFWFEPTPQGKFMLQIAFGQSKYYVDNLSENIKRGIRQKLHRGEWSWSAPLGYRNNARRKNIEPHPENGPILRKAFELYATGSYTLKALRDELTKLGLRTRSGKELAVASVQRMLSDPVYHGVMKINGELFPGSFTSLIGKTLFDKVQEVMPQPRQAAQRMQVRLPVHRMAYVRRVRLRDHRTETEGTSLLPLHQEEGAVSEERIPARGKAPRPGQGHRRTGVSAR